MLQRFLSWNEARKKHDGQGKVIWGRPPEMRWPKENKPRLSDEALQNREDDQYLANLVIMSNTLKRYKTRMLDNMTKMANVFPTIFD